MVTEFAKNIAGNICKNMECYCVWNLPKQEWVHQTFNSLDEAQVYLNSNKQPLKEYLICLVNMHVKSFFISRNPDVNT